MIWHLVQLYRAAALPGVIFEPATQCVEGVANGDMRIFMRVVCAVIAADDDLAAGDREINANFEHIALVVARVLTLHRDVASGDAIEEMLKLLGTLADPYLQRWRWVHASKGDLKRHLHR
jgi:hypothetical protein